MFGIAWGVVSIVLMTAAGEGLRVGQAKQAETLGRDVMIVFHGRSSLQVGGQRAGRQIHWVDTDVAAVADEANDCQYVGSMQAKDASTTGMMSMKGDV